MDNLNNDILEISCKIGYSLFYGNCIELTLNPTSKPTNFPTMTPTYGPTGIQEAIYLSNILVKTFTNIDKNLSFSKPFSICQNKGNEYIAIIDEIGIHKLTFNNKNVSTIYSFPRKFLLISLHSCVIIYIL